MGRKERGDRHPQPFLQVGLREDTPEPEKNLGGGLRPQCSDGASTGLYHEEEASDPHHPRSWARNSRGDLTSPPGASRPAEEGQ